MGGKFYWKVNNELCGILWVKCENCLFDDEFSDDELFNEWVGDKFFEFF